MDKIYYTQSEIDQMIFDLISQVQASGRSFEGVVGIANGGLHISHKIADALGIDHHKVGISCYYGTEKRELPIIEYDVWNPLPRPLENRLIVDDLIDSGQTMEVFDRRFPIKEDSAVAVLFWKRESFREPEFYAQEKPPQWIVFPWEKEDD